MCWLLPPFLFFYETVLWSFLVLKHTSWHRHWMFLWFTKRSARGDNCRGEFIYSKHHLLYYLYIYNNYFLQFEMRWYMYGSLKLFWLWTNPVSIWYAMKYLNFYSKLVLIWSVSTVCLFTSKLKRRKLYWSKQDFWRNFSIFMNKLLKKLTLWILS
jgi:hypothetical protein